MLFANKRWGEIAHKGDASIAVSTLHWFRVRQGWARAWRLHVRIVRAAMARVLEFGSVLLARNDTDLTFCIDAHAPAFEALLKSQICN